MNRLNTNPENIGDRELDEVSAGAQSGELETSAATGESLLSQKGRFVKSPDVSRLINEGVNW